MLASYLFSKGGMMMEHQDMEFVEHLGELRKRIIITLVTFILLFILSFIFVQDIYKWLMKDVSMKLAVLGPAEILWVYLTLAGIAAIAGTIPMATHQIWLFVRPALTKKEQKVTMAYVQALFVLFVVGNSFGYFIIFPIVFNFLVSLSEGIFETFFTIEKYFQFMLHMTLPFGFLFELPVIVMFLTSLGVLNPYKLYKFRKHAYFVLVVTAVLITPSDLLSDILVIIPLLFLYECSVLLSRVVDRKRKRKRSLTA